MKIAIYSHSYFSAENQKNITALARYCSVSCILPKKYLVRFSHENIFNFGEDDKIDITPLKSVRITDAQYILIGCAKLFKDFQPDVIDVEYNPWSLMALQALLYRNLFCRKAKLICTIKKNTFFQPSGLKGYLKYKVANYCLARTDHVIACSEMVSNLLISVFNYPKNRVSICHHLAVDTDLFYPLNTDKTTDSTDEVPIVVGYCGRLVAYKGVEDLLEAVSQVVKRDKKIILRLLGEGECETWLRSKQEKYEWLEVLPAVSLSEVAGFMRDLDIFVLPSRRMADHEEHDAHALLEALASGVASIGTTTGIIPEILADGTGCIIEPDDPHNLSLVIDELANNQGYRKKLALLGRKKAIEEFSLNVVARNKLGIFQKVIDNE